MIVLTLFLGALLRLISINQSLWLDEATSALVARDLNLTQIFSSFLPGDFHPPLYYLILKVWSNLFGYSEIALRMPSLIFGLGTIYITYLIGKRLFSKRIGQIASLFLATSGLHIYYSQEARMYSMVAFLASLLFYIFLKFMKEGGVDNWLIFSITLSLAFLTDYVVMFVVPVLWLYALITKQKTSWWSRFVASHSILVLALFFWWPIFLKQISSGLGISTVSPLWWKILGQTSFKNLVLVPVKFILGRISFDNNVAYGFVAGFSLLVFAFAMSHTVKKVKESLIVWLWLTLPVVLVSVSSFWIPSLSYFRLIFSLPALYLLVATGSSLVSLKYRNVLIMLILLVNFVTSGIYLFNPKFHREDWRGLVRAVEGQRSPDSMVIFVANSNMEAYRYYAPNAKIAGPDSVSKEYSQIFLMRYLKDVFDPDDKVSAKVQSMEYKLSKELDFNSIVVWKFEK